VGRDADGPKKVKVIYSIDNGANWKNLGTEQTIGLRTDCNAGLTAIDLSFAESANVLAEQPIMFRLYFYDAATAAGTCSINNSAIYAEEFMPVPLELIDFQGIIKQENHYLTWTTLNERNVSHFEIEQSNDGNTFRSIGQVKAVGNSLERQIYHFQNQTPQYLTSFYRLRMVDFDGKTDFSKTINIKGVSKKIGLKTYPNPTSDNLTVEAILPEQAQLNVTDILGKVIFSKKIEADTEGVKPFNIVTNDWAKGHYFMSILTTKGVLLERVVKL
jgi:Secretion system C-terminal sorting domain